MTIGLPRAMLYYRYRVLWETFFSELNCKTVTSQETNKKTLSDGIKYSIDESCLPSKIYMGHVFELMGKCDYILVPRIESYGEKNDVCVKLNALYDIVKNTFEDILLLDYNIDVLKGQKEKWAFIGMGRRIGKDFMSSYKAYIKAKKAQYLHDKHKILLQEKILNRKDKPKILMVAHPYNSYDRLIGKPISEYIQKLGGLCVYADVADRKTSVKRADELSDTLYWRYNRELIGSIKIMEDKLDGIILLTAFPCGPDSLVNELIIRKLTNIPTINILLDELQAEAGMQTRIESFLDIIKEKPRAGLA